MGHIPFCFYPSLLEQWLNCFNNLYMGKTFKRQIKCSLERVQIELSRGHWILNTTHISLSIQSYPRSQTIHTNPCTHTRTHNHPHSQSTHISTHTHTIPTLTQHTSIYTQSPTFSTQHLHACTHNNTHIHFSTLDGFTTSREISCAFCPK